MAGRRIKTFWTAICLTALLLLGLTACGGGPKPQPALIAAANRMATAGSRWFQLGCYEKAMGYFSQALETSRLSDDLPGMLRALNNLGAAALGAGRLEEAGEYFEEALRLNREVGDPVQESMILGNLAGLAYKSGKFEDAETFWLKAVEAARAEESHTGLALQLSNLGMLYRTRGRPEKAGDYLKQAEAEALVQGDVRTLAGIYLEMGLLAEGQGDLKAAERHLIRARELDKESENPRGIAQDLEKLGVLYQRLERWDEAALVLDRAIHLGAVLADKDRVTRLYGLLEKNQVQGGTPESLNIYRPLLEMKDDEKSVLCR